jgi:hypothetical protein
MIYSSLRGSCGPTLISISKHRGVDMADPNGKIVMEVPSTDGLVVIATSRPEPSPIIPEQDPAIVDWVETGAQNNPWWRFWRRPNPSRVYGCGHTGPRHFVLRIWGREIGVAPKAAGKHCPDCSLKELQSQSFRCCLCSLAVIPGNPVAVYDAGSIQPKGFEFKVIEGYALGCMDWNCCPTGGFYGGNWTGTRVHWWNEDNE